MKIKKYIALAACLLSATQVSAASNNPYLVSTYQDTGTDHLREFQGDNYEEFIDPHTGGVKLSNTILTIPGQGGLDLTVTRNYNYIADRNLHGNRIAKSPFGLGWDINFGRVWTHAKNQLTGNYCPTESITTAWNPIFESQDGSRKLLANATEPPYSDYDFVTSDQWVADCKKNTAGMFLYSPNGLIYEFNESYLFWVNGVSQRAFLVNKITDRNGNYLSFIYEDGFIKEVKANDGRIVTFHYQDREDSGQNLYKILEKVTSNGRSWRFDYKGIIAPKNSNDFTEEAGFLSKVTLPDNETWTYKYYDADDSYSGISARPGIYSMKEFKSPSGYKTTYKYKQNNPSYRSAPYTEIDEYTVVDKVIRSGTSNGGVWNYSYSNNINQFDETEVVSPETCTVYYHIGNDTLNRNWNGINVGLWQLGTLIKKETYNVSDGNCGSSLKRVEVNIWDKKIISNQNEFRPDLKLVDKNTFRPILKERKITQDNTEYKTTYDKHDQYGNPEKITQNIVGINKPAGQKVIIRTYAKPSNYWVLGLLKTERVEGILGNVSYDYDSKGQLETETQYGISTEYDYDSYGQLDTVTDPNENVTTYSNYYRGIARTIELPDNSTRKKTVDYWGLVRSETDGRNHTTHFEYDKMNRLDKIIPPKGTGYQTIIKHNFDSSGYKQTLTRGGFEQIKRYNGSGNLTQLSVSGSGQTIIKKFTYDELGRKETESLPYYSGDSKYNTTFKYDELNRLKRVTHPDSTFREIFYNPDNAKTVINERKHNTYYKYVSFGSPAGAVLSRIEAPEGVTTEIHPDLLGRKKHVKQGRLTRVYHYNEKGHQRLSGITHPEIGKVSFGYDDAGNTRSRTTGTRTTTYTYDKMNRLDKVIPPGSSATNPAQDYGYDKNGNLASLETPETLWEYGYDSHNNLDWEKLRVDGLAEPLVLDYDYNTLDLVYRVTPPSGLGISYEPDALGRPTKAGNFVTDTAYHANGMINTMTYANGQSLTLDLKPERQWIDTLEVTGNEDVADLSYGYDELGNIRTIDNYMNSGHSLSMTYDQLNRLDIAYGSWGKADFDYNTRGDLESRDRGNQSITYHYNDGKGRLTGLSGSKSASFEYDTYGNVINNGRLTFKYDDLSNLINICKSNSGTCTSNPDFSYIYDGHKRRVVHSDQSGITRYSMYNSQGLLAHELDPTTGTATDYIYLGSQLVAKRDLCTNEADCADKFNYEWYAGSFGSCSKTCGGGVKTREVYCKRSDGARVSNSFCSGTKPSSTTSCNNFSCEPEYDCTNPNGYLGDTIRYEEGYCYTVNECQDYYGWVTIDEYYGWGYECWD